MRLMVLVLLVVAYMPSVSYAQACENVISLSRTVATTVSDKELLEQHASNFCKEYSRSKLAASGSSAGASYKFLSASFGSTSASAESVASRYCSASNDSEARKDAFRQYVESIAPRAYAAYEACIAMQDEVKFELSTILPAEFSLLVSLKSSTNKPTATLEWDGSSGIECFWSKGGTKRVTVGTGTTTRIKCQRESAETPGYVTIFRADGTTGRMAIPWAVSTKAPEAEAIQNLSQQLEASRRTIDSLVTRLSAIEQSAISVAVLKDYVSNATMTAAERQAENSLCLNGGETACVDAAAKWCQKRQFLTGVSYAWNANATQVSCIGNKKNLP